MDARKRNGHKKEWQKNDRQKNEAFESEHQLYCLHFSATHFFAIC